MPFLFERTADQLWLFRLWYLAEIFLKMNKESLSLHRKLTVFINNDKNRSFQEKMRLLENLYLLLLL